MSALGEGIWIIPQLGRPRGFETLVESVLWADGQARVVVLFDDDDESLEECLKLLPKTWMRYVMNPGHSTSQKINYAVRLYPEEKFYGLLANDIQIKTLKALSLLAEHCPDYGLSYCDDSIQGRSMTTHPCVSGTLVKALGWWAYPKAKHTAIDLYLGNIAFDAGGCNYLQDVKYLHNHHSQGRSEFDEVYRKGDNYKKDDIWASEQWQNGEDISTRRRVREAMHADS